MKRERGSGYGGPSYDETLYRLLASALASRERNIKLARMGRLDGTTPKQAPAVGRVPPPTHQFVPPRPKGVESSTLKQWNDALIQCVCFPEWTNLVSTAVRVE